MGQHKTKEPGQIVGRFDPETGIAFANYRDFDIYHGLATPNLRVRGKLVPRVNQAKRALRAAINNGWRP